MADTDRIGDLPRWPSAARDLPDNETSAPQRYWRRGAASMIVYALASGAYTAAFMTPNTSWEHHPFAGPLVAIYESQHLAEFVWSLTIWAVLGAGLCWPVVRPSGLAVVVSVMSAVAWVAFGIWAAAGASC